MTTQHPRKAFLHVNGVTYELQQRFDSEHDTGFQQLAAHAEALARGAGYQFAEEVLVDRRPVRMHFTTQGVFCAGAFLAPERKPGRVIVSD